ncbi:MAG: hypothetical protein JOZ36_07810 [Acidobacteria bacterium]|nr:hypothetical protein [Acidobacteriota bacterium]
MLGMLKRHEVEILLRAGHRQKQVARLTGVSLCSVKRIAQEVPVVHVDDAAERVKRQIGRPSRVQNFRKQVVGILEETPELASLEILRRVREAGYQGGKTALYELVASLRTKTAKPLVRFEGLPGEFSQHDFGEVEVGYLNGTRPRIHFFASRLKYSRWVRVSLVKDEKVESLVRTLAEHLASWGGRPLLCVFDRPKSQPRLKDSQSLAMRKSIRSARHASTIPAANLPRNGPTSRENSTLAGCGEWHRGARSNT